MSTFRSRKAAPEKVYYGFTCLTALAAALCCSAMAIAQAITCSTSDCGVPFDDCVPDAAYGSVVGPSGEGTFLIHVGRCYEFGVWGFDLDWLVDHTNQSLT